MIALLQDARAMDGITRDDARQIAEQALVQTDKMAKELVMRDRDVIENGKGWLFIPMTKRFAETGDFNYGLLGSGGIFVFQNGNWIEVPNQIMMYGSLDEFLASQPK
jgi:hypothetical protein